VVRTCQKLHYQAKAEAEGAVSGVTSARYPMVAARIATLGAGRPRTRSGRLCFGEDRGAARVRVSLRRSSGDICGSPLSSASAASRCCSRSATANRCPAGCSDHAPRTRRTPAWCPSTSPDQPERRPATARRQRAHDRPPMRPKVALVAALALLKPGRRARIWVGHLAQFHSVCQLSASQVPDFPRITLQRKARRTRLSPD
jgi:hypothetical protein